MEGSLAVNLKFLCSHYKSVSLVCRKLDINRTQFNRYLSGATKPSLNILKRICDFFGVEVTEIELPHKQFVALLNSVPSQSDRADGATIEAELIATFKRLNCSGYDNLLKYAGYYYQYQMSMTAPGKVLKSLVRIEPKDGGVYFHRIERTIDSIDNKPSCDVYKGIAFFLGDKIFITDHSSSTGLEMSQTILYPSFKKNVKFLTGIISGVSISAERAPCSMRVVLEFIGHSVSMKSALRQCNFYNVTDPSLNKFVLENIENHIEKDDWLLRAKLI